MVFRDPKMVDGIIQNTLQQGVLFFGSTSILLIGALMAGLGSSDQALLLLDDLPFAESSTRTAWELKVMLVIFIFVFAFFKFAWSYRLFNYIGILIGAAPDFSPKMEDQLAPDADHNEFAVMVGKLHTLAARHFTTGLNSYFFALAVCAWFLSAKLFIAATIWVNAVLYRRAFGSNFGRVLAAIDKPLH